MTALSSLVAPGWCFFGSPRCHRWWQGRHCDNVTVYSEYISSMSPRRGRSQFLCRFRHFHSGNLRYGRRREYGIWMTASASRRTSELLMRLHILVPKKHLIILLSRYLLLIPYVVFHFKCVSYKYYTGFCVFTI